MGAWVTTATTWLAAGAPGAGAKEAGNLGDLAMLTGIFVIALLLIAWWQRGEEKALPPRAVFCPWGPIDVLFAAAAFLALYVGLGALINVAHVPQTNMWLPAAAMAVCGGSTALLILVLLHRRYALGPRDVGLTLAQWPRDLLLAVALLFFIVAVRFPLSEFFEYLRARTGAPEEKQVVVQQMLLAKSPAGLIVMIVVAIVVAPLWEEIAFRAFLQPVLRRYVGGTWAMVVTAMLFALIHDSGSRFLMIPVMLFPVGLALGYAYERTQRLWASILLHALHNAASVAGILYLRGTLP